MKVTISIQKTNQGWCVNVAGYPPASQKGVAFYNIELDNSFESLVALVEMSVGPDYTGVDLRVLAYAQGPEEYVKAWREWVTERLMSIQVSEVFDTLGVGCMHVLICTECDVFDLSENPFSQNHEGQNHEGCGSHKTISRDSTLDEIFEDFPETYLTPSSERKLVTLYYFLFGIWTFINFPL